MMCPDTGTNAITQILQQILSSGAPGLLRTKSVPVLYEWNESVIAIRNRIATGSRFINHIAE